MKDPDRNDELHAPESSPIQVLYGFSFQGRGSVDQAQQAVRQMEPFIPVHSEGAEKD